MTYRQRVPEQAVPCRQPNPQTLRYAPVASGHFSQYLRVNTFWPVADVNRASGHSPRAGMNGRVPVATAEPVKIEQHVVSELEFHSYGGLLVAINAADS